MACATTGCTYAEEGAVRILIMDSSGADPSVEKRITRQFCRPHRDSQYMALALVLGEFACVDTCPIPSRTINVDRRNADLEFMTGEVRLLCEKHGTEAFTKLSALL